MYRRARAWTHRPTFTHTHTLHLTTRASCVVCACACAVTYQHLARYMCSLTKTDPESRMYQQVAVLSALDTTDQTDVKYHARVFKAGGCFIFHSSNRLKGELKGHIRASGRDLSPTSTSLLRLVLRVLKTRSMNVFFKKTPEGGRRVKKGARRLILTRRGCGWPRGARTWPRCTSP